MLQPIHLTCNVNGADFTTIFTLLQWLPGILKLFVVPAVWLLVQHGCRCSMGRGCIASSVSHNWGWRGGKIFPFKIHLLKFTPGTGTKPNSDTSALLLLFPVYIPVLYTYLFLPAGYTHWCGYEVGFLSSCISIPFKFWASPLLISNKCSVHRIIES